MEINQFLRPSQVVILASKTENLDGFLVELGGHLIRSEGSVNIFVAPYTEKSKEPLDQVLKRAGRGSTALLEMPYIPPESVHSRYSRDSYEAFLETLKREISLVQKGISEWTPAKRSNVFTAGRLFETIELMVYNGASDIQILPNRQVKIRNEKGQMESVQEGSVMPEAEILEFLREVTRNTTYFKHLENLYLEKEGLRIPNFEKHLPEDGVNPVYSVYSKESNELLARLRINVHLVVTDEPNARGLAASIRKIPAAPPSVRSLGFNDVGERLVEDICQQAIHQGLVLYVGPTGSGKTNSMAATIEQLNERRPVNIVTIEDPVEIIYSHKKATIQQIEIGTCARSYAEAGRNALRQDPDVVAIGEIRDVSTAEVAVHLALTGHLVLGTMHAATTAYDAIQKLIEMVGNRAKVAQALQAIVAQRLISPRRMPKAALSSDFSKNNGKGGGRKLVMEVCRISNRNQLRAAIIGSSEQPFDKDRFYDTIGYTNSQKFCTTLEDSLVALVLDEEITAEDAIEFAEHKTAFMAMVVKMHRIAKATLSDGTRLGTDELEYHQAVISSFGDLVSNFRSSTEERGKIEEKLGRTPE